MVRAVRRYGPDPRGRETAEARQISPPIRTSHGFHIVKLRITKCPGCAAQRRQGANSSALSTSSPAPSSRPGSNPTWSSNTTSRLCIRWRWVRGERRHRDWRSAWAIPRAGARGDPQSRGCTREPPRCAVDRRGPRPGCDARSRYARFETSRPRASGIRTSPRFVRAGDWVYFPSRSSRRARFVRLIRRWKARTPRMTMS